MFATSISPRVLITKQRTKQWRLKTRLPILVTTTLLAALVLLTGCATPLPPVAADAVLQDSLYAQPMPAVNPAEGIEPSAAMRSFVTQDLAPLVRRHGAQAALGMVLQRRGWIDVEYDDTRTRTAAQAFEARTGNCLSLVMLTAALARELNVKVYFQEALAAEQWSRRADLHVASGHVNVTLMKPRHLAFGVTWDSSASLTIDFMPSAEASRQRTRVLDLDTLLAMYANNRAVESMAAGELRLAYAWARAAVKQDPRYLHALNTLAVVYSRSGHAAASENALREVLTRDAANTRALGNLVVVLRHQQRDAEADDAAAHLARLEPERPFQYLDLGQQALSAGEVTTARALFQRELKRDADYHETHF